jgi:predicted histidine transporter YuiF (NhaC family)
MENKMMSTMMMGVGAMIALVIGLSMVTSFLPEVTYYYCPICGDPFTSEQDLIDHFESAHPSEPIDIIWE